MTDTEQEDVGDEKKVKARKTKRQIERQEELEALRAILKTYGGRAFLWRLLMECKLNEFGFCGDNDLLNNVEGRRIIGGWALAEIAEANPKAEMMMRTEAVAREQENG